MTDCATAFGPSGAFSLKGLKEEECAVSVLVSKRKTEWNGRQRSTVEKEIKTLRHCFFLSSSFVLFFSSTYVCRGGLSLWLVDAASDAPSAAVSAPPEPPRRRSSTLPLLHPQSPCFPLPLLFPLLLLLLSPPSPTALPPSCSEKTQSTMARVSAAALWLVACASLVVAASALSASSSLTVGRVRLQALSETLIRIEPKGPRGFEGAPRRKERGDAEKREKRRHEGLFVHFFLGPPLATAARLGP